MAKLIGIRPESSKVRLRIGLDSEIALKDLLDEIDKNLPGLTVGGKDKSQYHFRIVGFDIQDTADATRTTGGFFGIKIFGRGYTFVARSNRLDAQYRTQPTEFYGLWHDAQFLKQALDKGATSGFDNIPVIGQWDDNGQTKSSFSYRVIVDVIYKDLEMKG